MKKINILIVCLCFISLSLQAQDRDRTRDTLGFRLPYSGTDEEVFPDKDGKPNLTEARIFNYRYYFRKVNSPIYVDKKTDKLYQKITIPGDYEEVTPLTNNTGPIGPQDYGKIFWIEVSLVKKSNVVYFPYRNDISFGVLTLPFKIRPKRGPSSATLLNGDLNIGTFVGWKFRLSSMRDFFVCPMIAGGITTINYNSSNNSILEKDKSETGSGLEYCAGVVFDFYKIQMGVVMGADMGMGSLSDSYKYQNAMWFSVSLNYNFLKYKTDKEIILNK